MSITTDVIALGAVGAGAYLVVTNIDKISEWIGGLFGQFSKDVSEAIQKGITEPVFQAGEQAGKFTKDVILDPIWQTGYNLGATQAEIIANQQSIALWKSGEMDMLTLAKILELEKSRGFI